MLTEARNGRERGAGGVVGEVRRRDVAEPRGPGAGVLLRASDPLESLRRGTAGVEGGQEDRSWTDGEEFR